MKIQTKRVYEEAVKSDGFRILIDRLWPRGLTKEKAKVDFWAKSIAPSNELRTWYHHDPAKWEAFKKKYFAELEANPEGMEELEAHMDAKVITFVFGSKEEKLSNAAALIEYLDTLDK